ncbi:MAG: LON peptidase substrate-binding domain-containing protein, partial [Acidobacteriota bacterium]|nr:LON peptidase substrate-binding domain-containing protein [Acidobacteriota bacterium]
MVLFPGGRVPFVVGRQASVKTLELAIKAGDHLLMLTQRAPKVERPGQEDLFPTGTLALVESVIALPKDYYKVGVKGIARVALRRYDDSGEVTQAEAQLLTEPAHPVSLPL